MKKKVEIEEKNLNNKKIAKILRPEISKNFFFPMNKSFKNFIIIPTLNT